MFLKTGCFPKIWLCTLDIMIGKEKGLALEKLRIIILVKANLQCIVRTFLGDKREELIESESSKLYL